MNTFKVFLKMGQNSALVLSTYMPKKGVIQRLENPLTQCVFCSSL